MRNDEDGILVKEMHTTESGSARDVIRRSLLEMVDEIGGLEWLKDGPKMRGVVRLQSGRGLDIELILSVDFAPGPEEH